MSAVMSDLKNTIIKSVVDKINKKLTKSKACLVSQFIKEFYGTLALEDLTTIEPADLYGAGLNLWQFFETLGADERKVRVYNPHFEQYGWQSTHTVVEICCTDMPFIVDSCSMELMRLGYNIHFIMHTGGLITERNAQNEIIGFGDQLPGQFAIRHEAVIHFEIDRQNDPGVMAQIEKQIKQVLLDVHLAVTDWPEMQEKMRDCIIDLEAVQQFFDIEECHETKAFLSWLLENHFTFLGYREYKITSRDQKKFVETISDSNLGVLKNTRQNKPPKPFDALSLEAQNELQAKKLITIAKSNTVATVHRPVYTDHISLKQFNAEGQPVGEKRFIGLYTSTAYNASPRTIPLLRHKVAQVMHMSGLVANGHAAKALMNILETLPRDDLFQASTEELYELCLAIYHLHERKRIRLFLRKDVYGHYFSCLVYVPRERYTSELRVAFQHILIKALKGISATSQTYFTESALARLHYIVRVDAYEEIVVDIKALENALIEAGRNWIDDVKQSIIDYFGEEKGTVIANEFASAFPSSYREIYSPRAVVHDIEKCLKLTEQHPLALSVYQFLDEDAKILHFKALQRNETLMLSDALPIFENLGMKVMSEQTFEVPINEQISYWINDFSMQSISGVKFKIDRLQHKLSDVFSAVCQGLAENDGFNQLVVRAELSWQQVVILRAYAKYMRQMGISFSQQYLECALNENAEIAKELVNLFNLRFNPTQTQTSREEKVAAIIQTVEKALEEVASLDQDRIIRLFLQLIMATLRTNYFQKENGQEKAYVSFKFDPALILDLPLPKPLYEIFVYSPRFEAVHLRGGKVARGGIRWSDRREDFRTEVLGLMKAQQVKNAVIVPQGAKGGFCPKLLPLNGTREQVMEEGIGCYQQFIRGLLDITDNLVNGKIVRPHDVICYDEADPYLVVAADKGTATFSDIANLLSEEYGFWLGDAFASGGSAGYDHKKMGITARGAWESVKCHFRHLGFDFKSIPFTVVGIGDMSGDVFGNGMLQSDNMLMVGAFNHQHIFIDPNPDPAQSFVERERLFALPRSTWEDYDIKLISKGGGIFKRSAKSIKVSEEMKERFGLTVDSISPNDLIKELLMAEVDLLWNGGIGTYIKASYEIDVNVGDRTNDAVRIAGNQVRAKIIAEGGNLGLTQLGRVEYSLNGGICFTDFIDNSAGVDCSDHEVNTKILLNALVTNGSMSMRERNELLADMTDEMAQLVLYDNYCQTKAINQAVYTIADNINMFMRYLDTLEQQNLINRTLEFLPDDKIIQARLALGHALTRPEIAVLFAYSKNILKKILSQSDIIADPELANMMGEAFPARLSEKFGTELQQHRLRPEIIATQLSNTIVNDMGLVFIPRMQEETGADILSVVRAYMIVRRSMELRQLITNIDALDDEISGVVKTEILLTKNRMVRRATRWLLKQRRHQLAIDSNVNYFIGPLKTLRQFMPNILTGEARETFENTLNRFIEQQVPVAIAHEVASCAALFSALDIIDGAISNNLDLKCFASVYFALGEYLSIDWLRRELVALKSENRWEMLARAEFRDELDTLQRRLTTRILTNSALQSTEVITEWTENHQSDMAIWQRELSELQTHGVSYTNIYIVLRSLNMLVSAEDVS